MCKESRKQVIVSTQVLESLNEVYIPNRSEISDLTNMIMDNVDGIMLAKETSSQKSPGRVVKFVKNEIELIIDETQRLNLDLDQ